MLVKLLKFFCIGCFVEIIHFFKHSCAKFIDQPHEIAADQPHIPVQPGGDVANDVEIKSDLLPEARPLHFHGHFLPPLQHTTVHLAQGGCGNGLPFQGGVDLIDRCSQVLLNARHGQGGIKPRQLVLQLGQFL